MAGFSFKMSNPFSKPSPSGLRYTQATTDGEEIEVYHDGKSSFDTITMGETAYLRLNDRVQHCQMDSCVGTVKWIGRYHGEEDEMRNFLVGVKLVRQPSLHSVF